MKTFPAEFLNVDLDFKSRVDPGPFVASWEKRAALAFQVEKSGRRHWLRLMLAKQPKTPAEAIRRFAKLARALPPRARIIWAKASKEFDIGIQAGFERRSGEWVLEPEIVRTVADLGARIRVTVYSPLLVIDEQNASDRKRAQRQRRLKTQ